MAVPDDDYVVVGVMAEQPARSEVEAALEFQPYRRKAIAELAPWHPGVDMVDVSISQADLDAGSPKPGDMIARNPENHEDKWLVAADYFAANFEGLSTPTEPTAEQREASPGVAEHAALTGICPWDEYGSHRWLPWLRLDTGSHVTRCLACGRVEQWDV